MCCTFADGGVGPTFHRIGGQEQHLSSLLKDAKWVDDLVDDLPNYSDSEALSTPSPTAGSDRYCILAGFERRNVRRRCCP